MALVAGSYERFIWGFSLKALAASAAEEAQPLAPLFSYPAHAGPIRCVAAAPRAGLAASGGADDSIRLYDLRAAADLGTAPPCRGPMPTQAACLRPLGVPVKT